MIKMDLLNRVGRGFKAAGQGVLGVGKGFGQAGIAAGSAVGKTAAGAASAGVNVATTAGKVGVTAAGAVGETAVHLGKTAGQGVVEGCKGVGQAGMAAGTAVGKTAVGAASAGVNVAATATLVGVTAAGAVGETAVNLGKTAVDVGANGVRTITSGGTYTKRNCNETQDKMEIFCCDFYTEEFVLGEIEKVRNDRNITTLHFEDMILRQCPEINHAATKLLSATAATYQEMTDDMSNSSHHRKTLNLTNISGHARNSFGKKSNGGDHQKEPDKQGIIAKKRAYDYVVFNECISSAADYRRYLQEKATFHESLMARHRIRAKVPIRFQVKIELHNMMGVDDVKELLKEIEKDEAITAVHFPSFKTKDPKRIPRKFVRNFEGGEWREDAVSIQILLHYSDLDNMSFSFQEESGFMDQIANPRMLITACLHRLERGGDDDDDELGESSRRGRKRRAAMKRASDGAASRVVASNKPSMARRCVSDGIVPTYANREVSQDNHLPKYDNELELSHSSRGSKEKQRNPKPPKDDFSQSSRGFRGERKRSSNTPKDINELSDSSRGEKQRNTKPPQGDLAHSCRGVKGARKRSSNTPKDSTELSQSSRGEKQGNIKPPNDELSQSSRGVRGERKRPTNIPKDDNQLSQSSRGERQRSTTPPSYNWELCLSSRVEKQHSTQPPMDELSQSSRGVRGERKRSSNTPKKRISEGAPSTIMEENELSQSSRGVRGERKCSTNLTKKVSDNKKMPKKRVSDGGNTKKCAPELPPLPKRCVSEGAPMSKNVESSKSKDSYKRLGRKGLANTERESDKSLSMDESFSWTEYAHMNPEEKKAIIALACVN